MVLESAQHNVACVRGCQLSAIYIRVVIMDRQIVIPGYEAVVKGIVSRHPGVRPELVEINGAAFPEVVIKAQVEIANEIGSHPFKEVVQEKRGRRWRARRPDLKCTGVCGAVLERQRGEARRAGVVNVIAAGIHAVEGRESKRPGRGRRGGQM